MTMIFFIVRITGLTFLHPKQTAVKQNSTVISHLNLALMSKEYILGKHLRLLSRTVNVLIRVKLLYIKKNLEEISIIYHQACLR